MVNFDRHKLSLYCNTFDFSFQALTCLSLQPHQPLPRIFHLSYPRVSCLSVGEEFLVMLDGFGSPVFFLTLENSCGAAGLGSAGHRVGGQVLALL